MATCLRNWRRAPPAVLESATPHGCVGSCTPSPQTLLILGCATYLWSCAAQRCDYRQSFGPARVWSFPPQLKYDTEERSTCCSVSEVTQDDTVHRGVVQLCSTPCSIRCKQVPKIRSWWLFGTPLIVPKLIPGRANLQHGNWTVIHSSTTSQSGEWQQHAQTCPKNGGTYKWWEAGIVGGPSMRDQSLRKDGKASNLDVMSLIFWCWFFGCDMRTRCPSNSSWGSDSFWSKFTASNSLRSTYLPATIWETSIVFKLHLITFKDCLQKVENWKKNSNLLPLMLAPQLVCCTSNV